MRSVSRKLISIFLVLMMGIALLPVSTPAANGPAVSLEQAIQKVKQNFSIPAGFTEFSSSFRSTESRQMWSLNWTDKENREGSFSAELDAATGVITSMHIYKQDRQSTEIPAISMEQAQKLGMDLLKRLIPDRVGNLQFIPNQQIVPLWNGGQYELHWQRMANNIPVGDEGATIQISNVDGSITGYNLNWFDKSIPSEAKYISRQDAEKVFVSQQMLELQYLIPEIRLYAQGGQKNQAQLVYRLNHSSHGLIDAVAGEPIENQDQYGFYDKMGMGGAGENASKNSQEAVLSPQEKEEIERLLNLIPQEKAVSIIRQWIIIPADMQLTEANLSQDYQNPDLRSWNLSWSANASSKMSYRFINARVNAITGEVQSFYVESGDDSSLKPVLDRAGAEKIAKAFVHKIQPEKENSVRLEEQSLYPQEKMLPAQSSFQFTRLVNGIPCPNNGIQIVVDTRTKQIRSYNLDWPEVDFPAPDKVLGTEKAYNAYFKSEPLTLHYELIYPNTGVRSETSGEYKLVYSPRAIIQGLNSDMIDAVTGEALSWDGTPVADNPRPYTFTDIAGYFAEKEISMLGQAGIMTEYGTAFHPQEKIRLVTTLRAMFAARSYYDARSKTDEEIIREAVRNKWLKEEMKPDTMMTRELLSKLMVRMLDIEYVALMPEGTLKAPYQDFAAINTELKGYAALTWGLGIIKGNGIVFDPAHQITRGEAAAALVRTIKAAGQRNNY